VIFLAIALPLYSLALRSAYSFWTCRNSSSTGVDRPKIVTMTFSVERSRLMSSTTPVKFVKGPSVIRTCSPF